MKSMKLKRNRSELPDPLKNENYETKKRNGFPISRTLSKMKTIKLKRNGFEVPDPLKDGNQETEEKQV